MSGKSIFVASALVLMAGSAWAQNFTIVGTDASSDTANTVPPGANGPQQYVPQSSDDCQQQQQQFAQGQGQQRSTANCGRTAGAGN